MKFVDSNSVPDNSVLLLGICYSPELAAGKPTVYTYALLKAKGRWYTSGGKGPQAAGWLAVERWLERDGREVLWMDVVTATRRLWPTPEPEAACRNYRTKDGTKYRVIGSRRLWPTSSPEPEEACRNYPHCDPVNCPSHGSARP